MRVWIYSETIECGFTLKRVRDMIKRYSLLFEPTEDDRLSRNNPNAYAV